MAATLVGLALTASQLAFVETTAQADTAPALTVDLSGNLGAPQHYGSGFIYGLTEDGQNPPTPLLTGMGFNYNRAGGAQLDSPGGWYGGTYPRHFQATLNQYLRTKSLGGNFVMLMHDLYGADGSALARWPGDNGDWSDYDAFLAQVISDVKQNHMDVEWDLWNEPDYPAFWPSGRQAQWLELWRRSYVAVKTAFPNAVIVGPSTNSEPDPSNTWWTTFLDYVKANNVVPTTFSWHEIPGYPNNNDPVASKADLNGMLSARGLTGPYVYQVNEYGNPVDQYPAKSAWYIARLERGQMHGLRSNWASGSNLMNDAAGLLYHDAAGYHTRAEWQTYAAYTAQSGHVVPVQTTNAAVDGYATLSNDGSVAKVLVGDSGAFNGSATLRLSGGGPLSAGGQVEVVTQRIAEGDGTENLGPTTDSVVTTTVGADGTVQVPLNYSTNRDAYSITVKAPSTPSQVDGELTLDSGSVGNLRSGSTTTVTTHFTNHGSTPQTGVTITPRLPAGWTASPTSQVVGTVAPGATADSTFSVTVPSGIEGSRLTLEFDAAWTVGGSSYSSTAWSRLTVPCSEGTHCEAENGVITNAVVATDHPGYSGTGFVAGMVGVGASVTNTVAVGSSGNYNLTVRYSAGPDGPSATSDRTMTLTVNGTAKQITLPKTTSWDVWSSYTTSLNLGAGASTVQISYGPQDTGWINLDYIQVDPAGTSTSAPVTTASTSPSPNGANGWWTSGPVSVALTATDSDTTAKIATTFSVDGAAASPYTGPFPISGDGKHVVTYQSVDSDGNVEAQKTLSVNIDSAAPTVSVTGLPTGGAATTGPVTATVTAADATSGVASTQYQLDGGGWTAYTAPITVTSAGQHVLQTRATDVAGNTSAVTSNTFTIAAAVTPATVTLTSSTPANAAGWYRSPVTVAIAAPPGSGSTAQYSLDYGAWTTAVKPFTVTRNAAHVLVTRLVDAFRQPIDGSGTQSVFGIDTGAPTATISAPVGLRGTPRNPVTLQWYGYDALSGVGAMTVALDGAPAATVNQGGSTQIASVGRHTVVLTVTDVAGNVTVKTATVTIAADPATTITAPSTMTRGSFATVQVNGFARYEQVTVTCGTTVLGQVTTDSTGHATLTFAVPTSLPGGPQTLTAVGATSTLKAVSRATTIQ